MCYIDDFYLFSNQQDTASFYMYLSYSSFLAGVYSLIDLLLAYKDLEQIPRMIKNIVIFLISLPLFIFSCESSADNSKKMSGIQLNLGIIKAKILTVESYKSGRHLTPFWRGKYKFEFNGKLYINDFDIIQERNQPFTDSLYWTYFDTTAPSNSLIDLKGTISKVEPYCTEKVIVE